MTVEPRPIETREIELKEIQPREVETKAVEPPKVETGEIEAREIVRTEPPQAQCFIGKAQSRSKAAYFSSSFQSQTPECVAMVQSGATADS